MSWTRWVGVVVGLGLLLGCVYGYQSVAVAYDAPYSRSTRPHPAYYCYDCHGYRYFDPYYDWCAYYGFRFAWSQHPGAVAVYRDRYVRIRENHPDYGRYRYRPRYRDDARYRDSRDYDAWRGNDDRSGRSAERDRGGVRKPDRSSPARDGKSKGHRNGHRGRDR